MTYAIRSWFALATLAVMGCGSVATSGSDARADTTGAAGMDGDGGGDLPEDRPGSDVASTADVAMEAPQETAPEVPVTECSPAQAPRPCYTGPAGTAGVGVCKKGTQACDATGHWRSDCSGEVIPSAEACNTMDDDCDGVVDNIPRSVFVDDTYADLATRSAGCTSGFDGDWLTCNQAIHRFCAAQACRTTGFGFAELGPNNAAVTCLSGEPTREVAAGDLATFGSCPSPGVTSVQAEQRFACQQAIHGYCKSLGFVSGFGPVGTASAASWTIVCLRSGHATVVDTTYDALSVQLKDCNGPAVPTAAPGACTAAAKRFCQVNNHYSGYGPVANQTGRNTSVVCVDL